MFNFSNLSDFEFEELCKDVMERKLSVKFRIFSKGRDGGIDLTDNSSHNIVVQVKHYINSTYSNLRTSLKKEKDKVDKLKPNQYFICCAMTLTESNLIEIYKMFSCYMKTYNNILTLNEINEYLSLPSNSDIVRKNYKLWLESSNILSEIYNQDIFIDCEALLNDIHDECKYFVQTSIYEMALDILEKKRMIVIVGAPGVGKTVTSKMLILHFADKGYRVKYTTNGVISDLKKALSEDKDTKEIILLDDCLGQIYFDMKSSQENELLSLMKYVSINPNKILILNSRIMIFNEAKLRTEEFRIFIDDEKIKLQTIDMSQMNSVDKAKIFYNHLIFKKIPKEYYDDIKANRNYREIINHRNYTPRIIEYVTKPIHYLPVKPSKYSDYIINSLETPNDIWKNEFERRMHEIDRIFMNTLYSLTDTTEKIDTVKIAFENRLKLHKGLDTTINYFDQVIQRLNGSTISIFDNKGVAHIGVINPSVNDYLKSYLEKNSIETSKIRETIIFHNQLQRCYDEVEYEIYMHQIVDNGTILNIYFTNELVKRYYIFHYVTKYQILNTEYEKMIIEFVSDDISKINNLWNKSSILLNLLKSPMCSFYNIYELIRDENIFIIIVENMELEELVELANIINLAECKPDNDDTIVNTIVEYINILINEYGDGLDVSIYCEDYDISKILEEATIFNGEYEELDKGLVTQIILDYIIDDVKDEIHNKLKNLSEELFNKIDIKAVYISESDIEGVIESYTMPDYDRDDYEPSHDYDSSVDIIDILFDR